ncbi:MAG: OsmC family protein [Flavobacteriaceae bacterium]|nr:OsmC family protein [Flavobacteriaceae bacterium]
MKILIKFDTEGKIVPFFDDKKITINDSPFLLFLASAGMCAAYYAKEFMQNREISLENVSIIETVLYNNKTHMAENINIHVELPETFPTKYKNAIKSAITQCTVKRHLGNPPSFEIQTSLDLVKTA